MIKTMLCWTMRKIYKIYHKFEKYQSRAKKCVTFENYRPYFLKISWSQIDSYWKPAKLTPTLNPKSLESFFIKSWLQSWSQFCQTSTSTFDTKVFCGTFWKVRRVSLLQKIYWVFWNFSHFSHVFCMSSEYSKIGLHLSFSQFCLFYSRENQPNDLGFW